MSRFMNVIILITALFSLTSIAQTTSDDELAWPRVYEIEDTEITLYQPQVERMDDNSLEFWLAMATKPRGSEKAEDVEYGSLHGKCKLDIDNEQGVAYCTNIYVDEVKYPGKPEKQESFKKMVNDEINDRTVQFSTEHLVASLTVAEITKKREAHEFSFKPPKIIIANKPTALVTIDGKPVIRKINDNLMRVINTPFVILFDQDSSHYFLRTGKTWRTSDQLDGPWLKATQIPKTIKELEKATPPEIETADEADNIRVVYEPTELIQI